jgi:hypothetical protein
MPGHKPVVMIAATSMHYYMFVYIYWLTNSRFWLSICVYEIILTYTIPAPKMKQNISTEATLVLLNTLLNEAG